MIRPAFPKPISHSIRFAGIAQTGNCLTKNGLAHSGGGPNCHANMLFARNLSSIEGRGEIVVDIVSTGKEIQAAVSLSVNPVRDPPQFLAHNAWNQWMRYRICASRIDHCEERILVWGTDKAVKRTV